MRSQEQAFRAYYAAMTDPELLRIAAHRLSYIPVAQRILSDEMEKRRLSPEAAPPPPVRHSVVWRWTNPLFRFVRRLHHHSAAT